MYKTIFHDSQKAKNVGLLILRCGIGLIFVRHGVGKLLAGLEMWHWLGSSMSHLGIHFAHTFWGFAAACAEALGGLSLIAGFGTRISAGVMGFVMFVAFVMHYTKGDAWTTLSHPLSLFVVFIALVVMGSGRYSLDAYFEK